MIKFNQSLMLYIILVSSSGFLLYECEEMVSVSLCIFMIGLNCHFGDRILVTSYQMNRSLSLSQ